jgi:hypothetical protein
MNFQDHFEAPSLHSYVCTAMLNDRDFKDENGLISIEDVLDAEAIYRAYPWILRNVTVALVSMNHRSLNGEGIRIVTLGGGEGTIFIAKEYYDDALDGKDPEAREGLAKAIVHELGHAVDDHNGDLEYDTSDEIRRAEDFANSFMKRWCK